MMHQNYHDKKFTGKCKHLYSNILTMFQTIGYEKKVVGYFFNHPNLRDSLMIQNGKVASKNCLTHYVVKGMIEAGKSLEDYQIADQYYGINRAGTGKNGLCS